MRHNMLIRNSHLQWVRLSAFTVPNLVTAWFVWCSSCWEPLGTNIFLHFKNYLIFILKPRFKISVARPHVEYPFTFSLVNLLKNLIVFLTSHLHYYTSNLFYFHCSLLYTCLNCSIRFSETEWLSRVQWSIIKRIISILIKRKTQESRKIGWCNLAMKFEIGIRPEIGVYVIGYDVYSIRLMSSVLNWYGWEWFGGVVMKSRRLGYTQSRQGLFTENICKDMGQKGLRRKSVGWREM